MSNSPAGNISLVPYSSATPATNPSRDSLTGLYQQDYLAFAIEQVIEKASASESGPAATLGLLQLKNFYEIRSWVGKSEANLLLSEIAAILRKALPKKVLLCRCRHYEFGILLLDDCSINSRLITDRVKQALLSAVSCSLPPQLDLHCAVGLAGIESGIASAQVMFARARHNLSVNFYDTRHCGALPRLNPDQALARLRIALERGQLYFKYQPIVSLSANGMQHYELDICHHQGEEYLPATLMRETAACNGLGMEIDKIALDHAINLLQRPHSTDLKLSVNVSHNSLVRGSFYYWLRSRIGLDGAEESGIRHRLILQIREIDVLIAQHHMGQFCERMGELGLEIGISHYGVSGQPGNYLSLLNARYAKLHVSLLEKINESEERLISLQKTVNELKEKNLQPIASDIDDFSLLPLIWRAGIPLLQGDSIAAATSDMNYQFVREERLEFP